LVLNVVLHAGTLVAIGVVLHRPLAEAVREGVLALRTPARWRGTAGGRDALFVVIASVPTALIGLLLRDVVAEWTHSPLAVGLGFATTTGVLVSSRLRPGGAREVPGFWGALLIGLAQGAAVVPGLSRSGATICMALWLGVRPSRAFELSMLASVPAVLGAVLLEAPEALREGAVAAVPAGVGAGVALVAGVVALRLLRGVVDQGRLGWFAWWTAPLAVLCLALPAFE
jgi:undecaprenyl-diphosphatase